MADADHRPKIPSCARIRSGVRQEMIQISKLEPLAVIDLANGIEGFG
jgi:hypothetical protein